MAVVDRTIAFASRRHRFDPSDAEEFASTVKLRLIENDYAILRSFEGRCSLPTFLNTVVQRMALDFRIHTWGKWHASAEAKRHGPLAVALEQLLHRDGRTLDEAAAALAPKFAGVTRDSLEILASRLPARGPRRREVDLAEAESLPMAAEADERLETADRQRASQRISRLVTEVIERMPEEERLILQLRFENGMSVAQIARALQLDQKLLYRRLERRMRELREEIERAGIDPADALDLIGRDEVALEFRLRNRLARPSMQGDETVANPTEASQ